MADTIEFLLPALKSGMEYTGFYAVAGSVGDLKQCEPLKELMGYGDDVDGFLKAEKYFISEKLRLDMLNEELIEKRIEPAE